MLQPISTIEQVYKLHPELQQDVGHLREWLTKQLHLPQINDAQLVIFLNSCEYSLTVAKRCIDSYYTIKSASPDLFFNRDPLGQDIQDTSKVMLVVPLSTSSPEGYRYFYSSLLDHDLNAYDPGACMKLYFMIVDSALRRSILAPGIVIVADVQGYSFAHAVKAFTIVKKLLEYIQEAMPVRVKAIHIINSNPVFTNIIQLAKPFISKESMEMMSCHSIGTDTLYKYVPQKIMPKDLGGEDDSFDQLFARTLQELRDNREWFLSEEENRMVDETKREGGKGHGTDLLGTQGSFKKLEID